MIAGKTVKSPDSFSEGSHGPTDPELEKKVKKTCQKISENLHIVANEPSLACYRLQEHVHKSLPQLIEKRIEVNQLHEELQGKCYDLEYSISAIKAMQGSRCHFLNIQELIKNAIFMKKQLTYEDSLRAGEKKNQIPRFQRFSGSFDLPSSFLPSMATISSSISASADLKNSSTLLPHANSPRRARASSVSSSPLKSAASTPAKRRSMLSTPVHHSKSLDPKFQSLK